MKLSLHFIENWKQRVGGVPSELLIREIMRRSVKIQGGKAFRLENGDIYKRLALYWHPEMDVVLFIDSIDRVAVSVLSIENYRAKCEAGMQQGG
jgi:hypothetical protein